MYYSLYTYTYPNLMHHFTLLVCKHILHAQFTCKTSGGID